MFTNIKSLSVSGLQVHPIDVEVDTGRGLPGMVIVGLPDKAIMESRDRVKTALTNAQMPVPRSRVTINLAPGDLKKEGPLFDLPIALGVMLCTGFLKPQIDYRRHWLVGELSLDGRLRPVQGVLNMARFVKKEEGVLVIPQENYREASLVSGLEVVPLKSLAELLNYFKAQLPIEHIISKAEDSLPLPKPIPYCTKDFAEVKGQPQAKRALTIAAAGNHNVLMLGPPGSGKSMLAERFATILPDLSREESIEVTSIYSVAGQLSLETPLIEQRPFRSPHHTISDIALIGGGSDARPGEISLAHRGVLFMDELPEFKRSTLEVLRQPLESGSITIGRAKLVCEYPSGFILIAAMNPCPCGYYGSRVRNCRCSQTQIDRYMSKLSGPLLDRIDIHLEVTDQSPTVLRRSNTSGPSSENIKETVIRALSVQKERFKNQKVLRNGEMRGSMIEKYCQLDSSSEDFLVSGMQEMGLSTRAYNKILMVSRTIADLDNKDKIELDHVAEALNFRILDQKLFD